MKEFAQILNNKVHYIFESEEKPEVSPDIVLIDITNLEPKPQEDWVYNEQTNTFSEPIMDTPVQPKAVITNEELQDNQLTLMDAIATLYEGLSAKGSI